MSCMLYAVQFKMFQNVIIVEIVRIVKIAIGISNVCNYCIVFSVIGNITKASERQGF